MEAIEKRIKELMSQLPPEIDDFILDGDHHTFSSGDCYIQHVPEILDKVQKEFLLICYEVTKNKVYLSDNIHRHGIVGRYLSDSNDMLYKYWYRFMCTDDKYREWGQSYFAMSEKAQSEADTKICINLKLPKLIEYFLVHMRDQKIEQVLK